jgi:hypothetical protein
VGALDRLSADDDTARPAYKARRFSMQTGATDPGRSRYGSFREFYPTYLAEHANRTSRRLHFVGTTLVIVLSLVALSTGRLVWLAALPVAGYGCAWIGHFFFEKNKPATFRHPLYSLIGDFVMFSDILRGRLPF